VPKLLHTYEVRRVSDNELLTTAETTQVLLHPDGNLALNFPPFLDELRNKWQAGQINLTDKPTHSWA
jgi:acyl-CoA thioesterase FadM